MWTTIAVILVCCAVASLTFVVFRIIAWVGALNLRVDEVWDTIHNTSTPGRYSGVVAEFRDRDTRSSAGRD